MLLKPDTPSIKSAREEEKFRAFSANIFYALRSVWRTVKFKSWAFFCLHNTWLTSLRWLASFVARAFHSLRHRLLMTLTQANSPRPHVSGYVWIRNFFLPSTRIRRIRIFLNPLSRIGNESDNCGWGNFWIRKEKVADWKNIRIRVDGALISRKKTIKQFENCNFKMFWKCNCEFCQYFLIFFCPVIQGLLVNFQERRLTHILPAWVKSDFLLALTGREKNSGEKNSRTQVQVVVSLGSW